MTTIDSQVGDSMLRPPSLQPQSDHIDRPEVDAGSRHQGRTMALAAGIYTLLSLFIWSGVWTSHPTSTTTCGCGDNSLFTWFLEWPAYAISHGLNPLHSTAMFYPGGVNLLANTSELAVGVVLAPVTWIFGPIATLNVAMTLAPVLSALAMYVLLRRWVSWAPAAFIGGLLYGFSPFILVSLTQAWLMLGMAMVPPLVVACLDELLFRQRRRPVVTGVALALLLTLQFFLGTEMLVIMMVAAVIGIVLTVVYAAWHDPNALRRRARYAVVGLGTSAIATTVLLAYPAWYALAGPSHLSGSVWPGRYLALGGTAIRNYVFPAASSPSLSTLFHRGGGYQGPLLSDQYFGIGIVVVLLVGMVAWRHDRRLWLFGSITAVSVVLSLGQKVGHWLPWQVVAGLPLLQNIIPSRFLIVTYLGVAVMLGLIVDHVYAAENRRRETLNVRMHSQSHKRLRTHRPRWVGMLAGVTVAAVAVVPIAIYLGRNTPMTTRSVVLPTWFRTVAPHLDGRQVLLAFPVPFAYLQGAMTWQAVDGMHYSMIGGGGPGSVASRAGIERKGQAVIADASFSFAGQAIKSGDILAVRKALDDWGVTMVVIPDQADLPPYDQVESVPFAVALMTAAIGARPSHQADAWVWTQVDHSGPSVVPTVGAFSQCAATVSVNTASIDHVASCVLDSVARES
jgi:hypothetical protein